MLNFFNCFFNIRRNLLGIFGFFFIFLVFILSLFAYVISPDNSSNANNMNLSIHSKKPGFKVNMMVFKNDSIDNISLRSLFWGKKISKIEIPIGDYIIDNQFLYYKTYDSVETDFEKVLKDKVEIENKIFLFGTDKFGRDVLSRVIFGYRVSLGLVIGVLGVAVPFGVILGLVAGYFGGWIETIIMRFTDVMLALPPLAMALAITAVLSPNLINAMVAITLLWWTWHTRLIYRIVKSQMNEDYVEAALVAGASHTHILFKELLPNCFSAVAVKISLDAGFVILFGAALSFLGLGVQPPTPDLGTMVATGSEYMPEMWWQAVMPGLAILYAILGFNLLGDGLRDMLDVEL